MMKASLPCPGLPPSPIGPPATPGRKRSAPKTRMNIITTRSPTSHPRPSRISKAFAAPPHAEEHSCHPSRRRFAPPQDEAAVRLEARAAVEPLPGLFQGFDQQENFGGHRVMQIRAVGQGSVAAAGDDGLEGVEEGSQLHRQFWMGNELPEE